LVESLTPEELVSENNLFDKLTNKTLLKKNIIWNLLGKVLPMGIAMFTIPLIIKGLGNERFGILTLIWMVIGYASLFDLGMGRALTQLVSKKIGEKDTEDLAVLIWTTLFIIFVLGIFASIEEYAILKIELFKA